MQLYLVASAVAIALVTLCILIHYETLVQLERLGRALRHHRWRILITVHGLLAAHVAEIWVFGFGYFAASEYFDMGELLARHDGWFDYVYYSAMVYTTVGFGDLLPSGGLRMITSAQALAGLSLITWSASFTFLQMQRMWRD